MWRAVGSSVVGSSHAITGTPCQDFSHYRTARLGAEEVLLIGLADGAGSAAASEVGAREAVLHVLQAIETSGLHLLEINDHVAAGWVAGALERLHAVAGETLLEPRDLACTLLFAILSPTRCLFAQVGDGAWVAECESRLEPVTWPSGGEYANQTTFITSPNWRDVFQFQAVPGPVTAVAGFTDGLQTVALHFASRSVHPPFFLPKFRALEQASDLLALQAALDSFLSSKPLLERTDDDKTLVLARWREIPLLMAASPAEL